MAIPRKKHYWKLRNPGLRELLLSKGWYMKGAYAEKFIKGKAVMLKTVEEHPDYVLCSVQYKADFWAELIAERKQKTSQTLKNNNYKKRIDKQFNKHYI